MQPLLAMTGKCEACGEESDDLVELPAAPDWAEPDLWCRNCANHDPNQ